LPAGAIATCHRAPGGVGVDEASLPEGAPCSALLLAGADGSALLVGLETGHPLGEHLHSASCMSCHPRAAIFKAQRCASQAKDLEYCMAPQETSCIHVLAWTWLSNT
jgi:hypothetical protein